MTYLLIHALMAMRLTQSAPITYRYDKDFGAISGGGTRYFPSASVMWAYKLVDSWTIGPSPYSLVLTDVSSAARPTLIDLLSRMNRPIVKEIAAGNTTIEPKSPADELAAGIALWTIACREDAWHRPSAIYFSQAGVVLAGAAEHGDLVGRSFASLAHAYCLLGDKGLEPGFTGNPVRGEPLKRLNLCKSALIATYNEFYSSVPVVSLKAAKGVIMLSIEQRDDDDIGRWSRTVMERFPKYRGWGPDN